MAVIPIIQQTWDSNSIFNPTRMNNIETNISTLSKATGIEYSSGVSVKEMLDKVPFNLSAESGVTVSSTDTKCTAIGNLVIISALFTLSSATTAKTLTLASVPSAYKPSYTVACHAVDNTNDIAVSGLIDNNGNIKIYRNGTQSSSTIRFFAAYVTN